MSRVFLPLAGLVTTLLILAALRLLNIASP